MKNQQILTQQAASIFMKAADYIRQYGWQEEGMGEDGAPRCSMGALDSVQSRGSWDADLARLMYASLYEALNGQSLTSFNHHFQSGERVAQLYEQVAKRLRAGQSQVSQAHG
jgi:hypothetical protein